MKHTDLYQSVTDAIVAALELGAAPWVKPWDDSATAMLTGQPHNRVSRKAYRGINTLLLWHAQLSNGFTSPAFLTYKQAADLGGHVRKGEKATRIVFYKPLKKENADTGKTDSFCVMRGYSVFNVEQCDELPILDAPDFAPVENSSMIDIAASVGANVRIEGNSACFIPSADLIKIPHADQFHSFPHFEATLAHELTHWTGHRSRLNRNLSGRFGTESYAAEELVAELGAAFLCAELGFNAPELRHAEYLASWLSVLKADKKAIFTAASLAQKACDFVRGRVFGSVIAEAA